MATYDLSNGSLTSNNLQSGDIINCPYTGNYKQITLPPGQYQLQCWGAQGGRGYTGTGGSSTPTVDSNSSIGGDQGYSCGTLLLLNNTTLYLYTGGHGQSSNSTVRGTLISGGFNGGGNSYVRYYTTAYSSCGSGGGASDIRIGSNSLYARVIVAGGGGGSGGYSDNRGKSGGGLIGYSPVTAYQATQTSAGTGGGFGQGANSYASKFNYNYGAGGGGGGWYGGGSIQDANDNTREYRNYNGGGSGYVYTSSTASNYPSGCLLNSSYYLTDALTSCLRDGLMMPSYPNQTFNEDNGFIRITVKVVFTNLQIGDVIVNNTPGRISLSLPKGRYKLECWGAEGGYRDSSNYAGKGGYSTGDLSLFKTTSVYLYAGGSGNTGGTSGGFNGGGRRQTYNGGGGASDIRINSTSLYARVIVAGGGGSDGAANKTGMYGGGSEGGSSTQSCGTGGYGGTQTGVSNSSWQTSSQSTSITTQAGAYAGFGFGGNGIYYSEGYGGAGGGGWYGGSGSYPDGSVDDDRGGGGGSGYIYSAETASNYPSGCLLNDDYYLTNGEMISGDSNLPTINGDGNTEQGHKGDGYVKITVLSLNPYLEEIKRSDNTFIYNDETKKYEQSIIFSSLPTSSTLFRIGFKALKNLHIKFRPVLSYNGTNSNYTSSIGEFYIKKYSDEFFTENKGQQQWISIQNKSLISMDFYPKKNEYMEINCRYFGFNNNPASNISNIHTDFSVEIEELNYIPVEIPYQDYNIIYDSSIHLFSPDVIGSNTDYLTYYTIKSGDSSGKNVGNYSTIVSLSNTTTSKWTDGTVEDKTVSWTIGQGVAYVYIQDIHFVYPNQKIILKYFYNGDTPSKLLFTSNEIDIQHNPTNQTIEFTSNKIGDHYQITGSTELDKNYQFMDSHIDIDVIEKYNNNLKLKKGQIITLPYIGEKIEIDLPKGKYHLNCYGAAGGFRTQFFYGGQGGQIEGILTLNHKEKLYCYSGGSGLTGGTSGGFNGGGAREIYNGGGGGTDIRIGTDSLYARVIVAGGGGSDGAIYLEGKAGGFDETSASGGCGTGGYGGYLDGVFDKEYQINNKYDSITEEEGAKAGFGFGGNGISHANGYGGAGGGGWYGGSGTYPDSSADDDRGGGGGSNFALCQDYGKYCPNNYLLDSEYFLIDVQGKNGTNEGDGYIQITVLDCPSRYYIKNNNQWKSINSILLKENGSWKEISELLIK